MTQLANVIDFNIESVMFEGRYLSFKLKLSDPRCDSFILDGIISYRGVDYYIIERNPILDEAGADTLEILAEINYLRLGDIKRVGRYKLKNQRARAGLKDILQGTGWRISEVNNPVTTYSMEATDQSVLTLIWQWATITGNEVHFNPRQKTVQMVPQIGANLGITFEEGRNLLSAKKTEVSPQATRLYPFGKNGRGIKAVNNGIGYIENYDYYTDLGMTLGEARDRYRKDEVWSDPSITDRNNLLTAATRRLRIMSQPQSTYEVKVADFSRISGFDETAVNVGDTVRLYSETIDIDSRARVTRKVVYPYEPERNTIELTFGEILTPNPLARMGRSDTGREWDLIQSRNLDTERRIRSGSSVLTRVRVRTTEDAEWVHGFKVHGIGVGTGTVTLSFTDDATSTAFWSDQVISVTPGSPFDYGMTFAQQEVPDGDYTFTVRAQSSGSGVGIDIEPGEAAYWILARGADAFETVLETSVRYDFTGEVQSFTVPDDVDEILVEAHGAAGEDGEGVNADPGKGTMVKARFRVTAGHRYEVYVGGPEWPDAGAGGGGLTAGGAGGGSTRLVIEGGSLNDSLVIAPGGGGSAGYDGVGDATLTFGGNSGFYAGLDGGSNAFYGTAGRGASDSGGGAGGTGGTINSGKNGNSGTIGQGGDAYYWGNDSVLVVSSGGGGGGYYGGGGGGGELCGGGGGTGYIGSSAADLEVEDAVNSDLGYLIISWDNPE